MKRINFSKTIATCAILVASLSSCENFRDNNGDLGGMWQLYVWEQTDPATGTTTVIKTNEDCRYYSIHRDVIQYTQSTAVQDGYGLWYYSLFTHTADSLFVYNFVNEKDESIMLSASDLQDFGIPANGRFKIDHLDSEKLTLSYTDNTLYFRKY